MCCAITHCSLISSLLHTSVSPLSQTPWELCSLWHFTCCHPPLSSLFSHSGLPLPPLTCKTSHAQGNLSISQEPSSTWSLCKEPQTCSITLFSFWLPCRNAQWPQDSVAALHMNLPPACLLGQLMSHNPVLNLEVSLDRDCTEYVTVWMAWPKIY